MKKIFMQKTLTRSVSIKSLIWIVFLTLLLPSTLWAVSGDFFEFHSYMRAGIGENSKGGDQVCISNPGTSAGKEFRLGNECGIYSEMSFIAHTNRAKDQSEPSWKAQFLLAYGDSANTQYSLDNTFLVEAFVEGHNLLGKGYNYWVGKRFYRDVDIYMNDFYYFAQMNGNGAGVSNIDTGWGNFSVALLNQVASENTDIGEPKTTALDFRLFDAPLTDKDQLNFWGAYGHTPEATKNDGTYLSETHSFVAGVRYRRQLEGGFNDLAITYGNKLLREFTLPETPYDDPDNDEYVIGDAFSFRVVEHLSTTITDNLQTYFSLIYERKDTGKSGDATISWYSVGARPVYFFSDAASLAFEAGYSLVEADQAFNDNSSGSHRLARFTLAGQLHPPIKNIWTRPVLRAFITHSRWNDNNIGEVGGDAYANKTDATQFGFQTEVWF